MLRTSKASEQKTLKALLADKMSAEEAQSFYGFLKCLMEPDPDYRYSASAALRHEWITGEAPRSR